VKAVAALALALLFAAPVAARARPAQADAIERAWAALDAAPVADVDERREELLALSPRADVALAGLRTLDAESIDAGDRRERARIAREHGDERGIELALAALDDADDTVREDLADYLGERRLLKAMSAERVDALAELALRDRSARVRQAALEGLAAIDDPRGLARLDRLLDEVGREDRGTAAQLLAAHAGARERLVRRVRASFDGAEERPLDGVALARMLEEYGQALAHLAGGGETPADRLPLIAGRAHPVPLVRTAAGRALDGLVAALARRGEVERADRVLALLEDDGLPRLEIEYRRANLALTSAADPAPAVAGARAILATVRGSDDLMDREWRARGALLAAAAEIAGVDADPDAGDAAADQARIARARASLDLARETLQGLLAERIELYSSPARRARGNDEQRAFWAHLDCLVDLWRVVIALAEGARPGDAALLGDLRAMHVRQLRAQALAAESGARFDLGGFGPLLDDGLGPVRLLLLNVDSAAWPPERALGVQAALGDALAGVSAFEMPGFSPPGTSAAVAAMSDPIADPERKRLLTEVLQASLDGVMAERTAERDRARPDEDKLDRLFLNFRVLMSDLRRARDGEDSVLRRVRTPSDFALDVVIRYLEDGNAPAARALAERMKSSLFDAGALGGGVSEPLVARLEAAVGSACMDQDDPAGAEQAFRQAVTRLEAYEDTLKARVAAESGDPELRRSIAFALAAARSQRADALLSLAVNANVKQKDTSAALEWFEQAFELKQTDFMRVLLACYRARSGRDEEARAVLREVSPDPTLFYNLACTHALLGDLDVAVDFLARELAENQPTERARERQRQWARDDPDLEALRGYPPFERLVGGS